MSMNKKNNNCMLLIKKSIILISAVLFTSLFIPTFSNAALPTDSNSISNISKRIFTESVFSKDVDSPMGNNISGEVIDERTGNLQVVRNDLTLKGVNGLDFSLNRIYDLSRAVGHGNQMDQVSRLSANTYTITYYVNFTVDGCQYSIPETTENNAEFVKELYIDYNPSIVQERVYPGIKEYQDLYSSEFSLIDKFDIGLGWSFDIPYIANIGGADYLSYGTSGFWKLNNSTTENQIEGYRFSDVTMQANANNITINSFVPSRILKTKEGLTYYFDSMGDLRVLEDRYGNQIKYYYTTFGNTTRLSYVIDTVGRRIEFVYRELWYESGRWFLDCVQVVDPVNTIQPLPTISDKPIVSAEATPAATIVPKIAALNCGEEISVYPLITPYTYAAGVDYTNKQFKKIDYSYGYNTSTTPYGEYYQYTLEEVNNCGNPERYVYSNAEFAFNFIDKELVYKFAPYVNSISALKQIINSSGGRTYYSYETGTKNLGAFGCVEFFKVKNTFKSNFEKTKIEGDTNYYYRVKDAYNSPSEARGKQLSLEYDGYPKYSKQEDIPDTFKVKTIVENIGSGGADNIHATKTFNKKGFLLETVNYGSQITKTINTYGSVNTAEQSNGVSVDPNNLIQNASFENAGLEPWNNNFNIPNSPFEISVYDSHKGDYALRILPVDMYNVNNTSLLYKNFIQRINNLTPNTRYLFKVWHRGEKNGQIKFVPINNINAASYAKIGLKKDYDWNEYRYIYTTGPNETNLDLYFQNTALSTGNSYFDDFSFEPYVESQQVDLNSNNSILNADFTNGVLGSWNNNFGITPSPFELTTSQAIGGEGDYSLCIKPNGTLFKSYLNFTQTIANVTPNTFYVFKVWHKGANNGQIKFIPANDASTDFYPLNTPPIDSDWKDYTCIYKTGPYETAIKVFIQNTNGNATENSYFDGLSLRKMNETQLVTATPQPTEITTAIPTQSPSPDELNQIDQLIKVETKSGYLNANNQYEFQTNVNNYVYDLKRNVVKEWGNNQSIYKTYKYDDSYNMLTEKIEIKDSDTTIYSNNTLTNDGKSIVSARVKTKQNDDYKLVSRNDYIYDSYGNCTYTINYSDEKFGINKGKIPEYDEAESLKITPCDYRIVNQSTYGFMNAEQNGKPVHLIKSTVIKLSGNTETSSKYDYFDNAIVQQDEQGNKTETSVDIQGRETQSKEINVQQDGGAVVANTTVNQYDDKNNKSYSDNGTVVEASANDSFDNQLASVSRAEDGSIDANSKYTYDDNGNLITQNDSSSISAMPTQSAADALPTEIPRFIRAEYVENFSSDNSETTNTYEKQEQTGTTFGSPTNTNDAIVTKTTTSYDYVELNSSNVSELGIIPPITTSSAINIFRNNSCLKLYKVTTETESAPKEHGDNYTASAKVDISYLDEFGRNVISESYTKQNTYINRMLANVNNYNGSMLQDASEKTITINEYDLYDQVIKTESWSLKENIFKLLSRNANVTTDYAGRVLVSKDLKDDQKVVTTTTDYDVMGRVTCVGISYEPNTATIIGDATPTPGPTASPEELNTMYSEVKYEYDSEGRQTAVEKLVDEAQNTYSREEYEYDKFGNKTKITIKKDNNTANDQVTRYTYNAQNKVVFVASREGYHDDSLYPYTMYNVTEYVYNDKGQKIKMIRGSNVLEAAGYSWYSPSDAVTTSYVYDDAGNLIETKDPLGKTEKSYYKNGKIWCSKDKNDTWTIYKYDVSGNKINEKSWMKKDLNSPRTTDVDYKVTKNISLEYFSDNKLAAKRSDNQTTYYYYNANGTVMAEDDFIGSSFISKRYSYNELGNKVETWICGDKDAQYYANMSQLYYEKYSYDSKNRLSQVLVNNKPIAEYDYDLIDRVKAVKYLDQDGSVVNTVATTDYKFDNANHVTNITSKAGGTVINDYNYQYLLNGQLDTRTENNTKTEYEYYPMGSIKTVKKTNSANETIRDASYTYDNRNNRLSQQVDGVTTDYQYDLNDKLLSSGSGNTNTTYGYDNNGNQLCTAYEEKKTYASPSEIPDEQFQIVDESETASSSMIDNDTQNTYNGDNQLTTFKKKGVNATYNYDLDSDLRTEKTVNDEKTIYVWDGDQLILELNGNYEPVTRYYRGISLIAKEDASSNAKSYYLYNQHGDVTTLIDKDGITLKSYDYDEFGNELNPSSTDKNPFRYSGEYYDTESGSIYLRARYYNPEIGRFISEDSYKGEDNDPLSLNLYTYCANDAVNQVDPTGHDGRFTNWSKVWSFKNDWAGREILWNYLYGGGETKNYVNDSRWKVYMESNLILTWKIKNIVINKCKTVPTSSYKNFNIKTHIEIENGEDIIGYQYLHGTNSSVGGFKIKGRIKKDSRGTSYINFTYQWNDKIDPNFMYTTDKKKSDLAKKIPYANPKDYIIRISWSDKSELNKNGIFVKGWLSGDILPKPQPGQEPIELPKPTPKC